MNNLERVWGSRPATIESVERRHLLILAAQGPDRDDAAVLALLAHHVGLLRGTLRRFNSLEQDEARSLAVLALLVSVDRYEGTGATLPRLVSTLLDLCWDVLAAESTPPVGARTLRRYAAAVRKANGNMTKAEELARAYGVGASTFRLIAANRRPGELSAVDGELRVDMSERPQPVGLELHRNGRWSELAEDDSRELVKMALEGLSARDRAIIEHSFGFLDGVPHTDDETAEFLRSTRGTVQRRRSSAILAMRNTLGV